jgi:hypothetical protein
MDSASILIWNVWGLNDRDRLILLGLLLFAFKKLSCLIFPSEMFLPFLGPEFTKFVYLPVHQTRGGILIAWRDGCFSVDHHHVHHYSVSVLLSSKDGPPWWLTGVYGPQHDADKVAFLEDLHEVRENCPGPWMLAGDFNTIYCSEDKNNDNINRATMGRFRRFVNYLELKEIPLLGRRCTWSNEREHQP